MAYKRVVLKISGEALSNGKENIDFSIVKKVAGQVAELVHMGIEVCVIIGGGNIWRGRQGKDMNRVTADHMGMLATVINSLAFQDMLESMGIPARLQTAIEMRQIAEPFIRRKAVRHLEKGRVVIFACGTGNPYFTTDMAAALRAAEMEADLILLAKNVDGIYDSDPQTELPGQKIRSNILYRFRFPRPAGDGYHCRDTVHGKQYSDSGFWAQRGKWHYARRAGRKDRYADPLKECL